VLVDDELDADGEQPVIRACPELDLGHGYSDVEWQADSKYEQPAALIREAGRVIREVGP
jgi:hypothetical protein